MVPYASTSNQKGLSDGTQASGWRNAIRYVSVLPCSIWLQSLSHCELITDDGIRHLGNGACAHDQLEVIELDNCPLITDASLEHLKSCHSLERIELYDCQQISRAGIKRLRVKMAASPSSSSVLSILSFSVFQIQIPLIFKFTQTFSEDGRNGKQRYRKIVSGGNVVGKYPLREEKQVSSQQFLQ